MKKIVNLTLSLFLISSMMLPFSSFLSFDEMKIEEKTIADNSDYEYEYNKAVLDNTAENLVYAANELLLLEGIKADNIKISLKKSDNNSIYISSINIYINKEYEHRVEDIAKIISSNMSKQPEIILNE